MPAPRVIRLPDGRVVRLNDPEVEPFVEEYVDGVWVKPAGPVYTDSIWVGKGLSDSEIMALGMEPKKPKFNSERIDNAYKIAFQKHKGQTRKGTQTPYVVHPCSVAYYLMSLPNIKEDVVIAGILHDTLEDTSYTPEELERDFGPNILRLVQSVSEPDVSADMSDGEKKRSWKNRKQHTVDSLKDAGQETLYISLADKLSNLRDISDDYSSIGEKVWDKFRATREDVAWYYRSLRDIFKARIPENPLFNIYDKLVDETFS